MTSIDILPERVEFLENIHRGGIEHLCPVEANLCEQPFPENSFDVITLLEVLEHIHLLTKEVLTELFTKAGCRKLKFDGVNGHLIMVASL